MSCSNNGRLGGNELRPIAGGGYLSAAAAAAWNALAQKVYAQMGHKLSCSEAYRDIDRQWYFWNLYQSGQGNLAAYPGTSNHGCGVAVDLSSTLDRAMIDRFGSEFGWSKSWSDAPSEWWHVLYQSGHYSGRDPGPGYAGKPKKPSWWRKLAHKIKTRRKRRLSKKQKRDRTDDPDRRAELHRQIQKLGDEIDRMIDRRKDWLRAHR